MNNLFDYITWRGDLSFDSDPLNEIDAVIFAQVTYILMDGVVSDNFRERKTLAQFREDFKALPDFEDRLEIGFLINDKTTEFLFKCSETNRFKDVEICCFQNIFSEENVEQFAAVTFKVGNKVIVSYRGTDDTIIGLEEDFRIAYLDEIPAQHHALEYFESAVNAFPFSDFILVGHSKGGNLALNTAVNSSKKLRKKIESVYNFDGPGFNLDFYKKPEFLEVESRIYSYYPKLSVVGMLFHHPENYEIVDSDNFAFMQHDAMAWKVSGNGFINMDDFTDECKFFYNTFNNWIDRVSLSERKDFVDATFFLLKASGYKTYLDIERNSIPASARMISAYTKLDKQKKDAFRDMFGLFIETVKNEVPLFKALSNSKVLQKK